MKTLFATMITIGAALSASASANSKKIISIGGSVSEIVCALGHCDEIVAVDATSIYPASLNRLPKLGYYRQISAEGVYRQQADTILMVDSAGPPNEIDKLRSLKTNLIEIDSKKTLESAKGRINALAKHFGKEKRAAALLQRMEDDLALAKKERMALPPNIKILFIYSRGKDKFLGAGKETAPAEMFSLLNIENAYQGTGYKQMSSESLIKINPDVIVFPKKGNEIIDYQKLANTVPGIALTKAFKSQSIIVVDDLKFLGFTHRLGEGARDLVDTIRKLQWIN